VGADVILPLVAHEDRFYHRGDVGSEVLRQWVVAFLGDQVDECGRPVP
jgi:hypothetical protein